MLRRNSRARWRAEAQSEFGSGPRQAGCARGSGRKLPEFLLKDLRSLPVRTLGFQGVNRLPRDLLYTASTVCLAQICIDLPMAKPLRCK